MRIRMANKSHHCLYLESMTDWSIRCKRWLSGFCCIMSWQQHDVDDDDDDDVDSGSSWDAEHANGLGADDGDDSLRACCAL